MAHGQRLLIVGFVVSIGATAVWAEPAKSLIRPGMPADGYRQMGTIKRSPVASNAAAVATHPGAHPSVGSSGGGSSGGSSGGGGSGSGSVTGKVTGKAKKAAKTLGL